MKTKVLIADDDMDAHQLMYDVIEITFRDVKIERALCHETFWAKIAGNEMWDLIFVSAEYIVGEENFAERVKSVKPGVFEKLIVIGERTDHDALKNEEAQLPFIEKPFSLDAFEETVKLVHPI